MNAVEQAVTTFESGFSCSQAVLSAFAARFGLDPVLGLRVGGGFGGGIARLGKTCGAVTGAIMVIGLKEGQVQAQDEEAKERTYTLVRELVSQFTDLHGSIACRDLLGLDLSRPEELAKARQEDLFHTRCPAFVRDAAKILETLIA